MPTTLFDIAVAPEVIDWIHCHLVMEISPRIFSYAMMGPDKKVLQLRFYELDTTGNNELLTDLQSIIATDEILRTETKKKTLIYNFPESQLVPEEYFNINDNNELTELLHGDLTTGITLCEKVKSFSQYNVFRIPDDVYNLMQHSFADAEYRHYYSLWMECAQKQVAEQDTYLSVLFYPHRVLVSAVKNNQVQLVQSYEYDAAEDVGYYLLNICKQLQLPPDSTTVVLSGMIDVSSALYTEIAKYFGTLMLEALPDIDSMPALQEYPAHFFSPLLKLAVCVS